jgi:TrmH family RNA methyltransferase
VGEGAERLQGLADERLPVTLVSEPVIKALSGTATPQGVVAVAATPPNDLSAVAEDSTLVLVLASVRDPGNAGTLVRTARAVGADAVCFTTGSVDPYGPKTVRASAGSLFGLKVVHSIPTVEAATHLRGMGLMLLGADARAPTSMYDADLRRPVAFVVGNEAWGLPEEISEALDARVSIPMPGPVESLNVSVAGSLLLFEAARQRRDPAS